MGLALTRRLGESLVCIDLEAKLVSDLQLVAIADGAASFLLDGVPIDLVQGQAIACKGCSIQLHRSGQSKVALWIRGKSWSECYRRELLDKFFNLACWDDAWLIEAVRESKQALTGVA